MLKWDNDEEDAPENFKFVFIISIQIENDPLIALPQEKTPLVRPRN